MREMVGKGAQPTLLGDKVRDAADLIGRDRVDSQIASAFEQRRDLILALFALERAG